MQARYYVVECVHSPRLNRRKVVLVHHFRDRQKPLNVRSWGVVYLELRRPAGICDSDC